MAKNALVAVVMVIILVGVAAAYFMSTWRAPPPETTTPTTTTTETTTVETTPPTETTAPTTTTTTPTTTTEPPSEGIILVVLTRHPGDILKTAKEEFLKSDLAKKYNIVDIKFIAEPPGWWSTHIKERGGVDIGWGGGPTLFDMLYSEGLLAPLTSPEVQEAISQIPEVIAGSPTRRIGPDGQVYWVAAAIASFGFTVNHDKLSMYGLPTPNSWAELGSPEFGRSLIDFGIPSVGIADPTQSTSNTRMYEIILQRFGWDEGWKLLTAMAANAQVYQGSGDVRDAVIRGDIAVGITIDFYGYTAQIQNPACEYIIPEGETIVNGDPIALLVSSEHPEAAQAFIAWVLTDGQKIWLSRDINRLPANPNVFNTPEGQQRHDLQLAFEEAAQSTPLHFNDTLALEYETAMRYYFKAVLVEVNSELKQVWTALLNKYFYGGMSKEEFDQFLSLLGAPLTYTDPTTGQEVTFTQEDAIRVNKIMMNDPAIIDHYLLAWKQAAAQKYNQLLQQIG